MDRNCTTGIAIKCNGCPIDLSSCKRSLVALDTAEAEHIAVTSCPRNTLVLLSILIDSGLARAGECAIHTNNQAACHIVASTNGTKRRKFIDLRHHYILNTIRTQKCTIKHIPGIHQKTDSRNLCAELNYYVNKDDSALALLYSQGKCGRQ